jgi:hypothetical protein
MAHDREGKQEINGQRRHNALIDGSNRLGVIPQKCLPGLRWWPRWPHHMFRDRRLGELKAKHEKLAVDPRRTPARIFPDRPLDQITQIAINPRPPCPIL